MAYLPELHYCCVCKEYLGPDNGDGICADCDTEENAELEYEEAARDKQEEKEECYHTWDEANYNGFSQSDFI